MNDNIISTEELAALRLDAERYRKLRQQDWNASTLFVVSGHHTLLHLGTDCPSRERLDAAVDALP